MDKSLTPSGEPVQDGLLTHYLACAAASDVNVERRIKSEPFFLADYLRPKQLKEKLSKLISK